MSWSADPHDHTCSGAWPDGISRLGLTLTQYLPVACDCDIIENSYKYLFCINMIYSQLVAADSRDSSY